AAIYGMEAWHGTPLLVQEYLEGGSLAMRLALSPMDISDALDTGVTLARLLEYLHERGIIHCDIKPSNVGYSREGVLQLVDFGIVRVLREVLESGLSTSVAAGKPSRRKGLSGEHAVGTTGETSWPASRLAGTPQFMSPEAALGEAPAPSFDLWALAVVLYEA